MKRACALFALLGGLLLAGAWRDLPNLGAKDWNWFFGQTQAEVTSLLRYGQFPMWSPWRHGGQVGFAQPESMLLSPVTPLALLLGTVLAFKLLLLPVYVAGALGLVALAEELGLHGHARLVPALVFFGSGVFPMYVLAGLPNWLCALAILPWLLWSLRRARRDLRFVLLAALLYAGLLYCGAIFWFALLPLLLLLDALAQCLLARSVRPLLLLAAVLVIGLALAAPRVLPLFAVHAEHPREVAATGYFLPPAMALSAWLSTDLPDLSTPNGCFVISNQTAVYWPFVGAYVGPLAALFALLGLCFGGTRAAGWLVAGAACFWAALGSGVSPSLWDALHALPGIASMQVPARLLMPATFCLALLAGFGWERLEAWLARARMSERAREGSAIVLLALLLAPMVVVNAPLSAQAFTVAPTPDVVFAPQFRQRETVQRKEQWMGEAYESVLANVGNPGAASDIPSPVRVTADNDPAYRGEVYLLSGAGDVQADLSPNRIDVAVRAPLDDLLVVNQSYFPGWRVEGSLRGEVQPYEDLLALPVPAGEHHVTLVFAPASVPRGFQLGALGLLLGGAYLVLRRGPRATAAAPEWLALAGFGVLAAAVAGGWSAPGPTTSAADVSSSQPLSSSPWWTASVNSEPLVPIAPPAVSAGPLPDNALHRAGAPRSQVGAAPTHAFPADLQAQLDGAAPGSVLALRPGRYYGLRLTRGVTLAALPGEPVELDGPVRVDGLPADERVALLALPGARFSLRAGFVARQCAGELLLQRLALDELSTGPSLLFDHCARAHLVELRGGALVARSSGVSLLRCRLRGGAGTAALQATESSVLLDDTVLAAVGGAPALSLQHGTGALVYGPVEDVQPWEVDLDAELLSMDASSPRVRLHESRYGGGTLLLDMQGAPGARGLLVLSRHSVLLPLAPAMPVFPGGGLLVADPRETVLLPVTLPLTGRLEQRLQIPAALRQPGTAIFAQFAAETAPGSRIALLSPPDAALLELQGERR